MGFRSLCLLLPMLVFTLSLGANLLAGEKEGSLLAIQAKLYPRIILFDKEFRTKTDRGTIVFAVVTQHDDYQARIFAEMVAKQYPDGVKGMPLRVEVLRPDQLRQAPVVTAVYLFQLEEGAYREMAGYVNEKGIASFAYDVKGLSRGALVTLKVAAKTRPMVNKKALGESGVTLSGGFLGLSEIYQE